MFWPKGGKPGTSINTMEEQEQVSKGYQIVWSWSRLLRILSLCSRITSRYTSRCLSIRCDHSGCPSMLRGVTCNLPVSIFAFCHATMSFKCANLSSLSLPVRCLRGAPSVSWCLWIGRQNAANCPYRRLACERSSERWFRGSSSNMPCCDSLVSIRKPRVRALGTGILLMSC